MSKQANILSFDEVKRGSSARRSAGAYERPRRARIGESGVQAAPAREASVHARHTRFNEPLAFEESVSQAEEEQEAPEKLSRLSRFRRKRQKQRADKKFTKQFGETSSAAESQGPRAAVYKGEMGSSHKRSSRMQNDASGARKGADKKGFSLTSLKRSPKFIASVATVTCLALTCWFLYTPAQHFYQSVRERDRLQAEYVALEQRNDSLQAEVARLQTDAGIEDRAHAQFGWVPEGYETATVKGLSESEGNASNFRANIVPGSIEAPQTWYSPVLDVIFKVK